MWGSILPLYLVFRDFTAVTARVTHSWHQATNVTPPFICGLPIIFQCSFHNLALLWKGCFSYFQSTLLTATDKTSSSIHNSADKRYAWSRYKLAGPHGPEWGLGLDGTTFICRLQIQINPFRPSASNSAKDSQSSWFKIKMFRCLPLLKAVNLYTPGLNPLSAVLLLTAYWCEWTSKLIKYHIFGR